MSKVDKFLKNLYCASCGRTTEHLIEKIDKEINGEYISHYAKCSTCNDVKDFEYQESGDCLNCGHSFSTEDNKLICVFHGDTEVEENSICTDYN